MTASKYGTQLPQCAAQLGVLQATGQEMNKAFGEMRQEFQRMQGLLNDQIVSVSLLTTQVSSLTSGLERLNNSIDTKITNHKDGCLIRKIVDKKAEQDITKRLKLEPSIPPPQKEDDMKKWYSFSIKTKIIAGIIASILTVVGTVLAYIKG